MVKVQLRRGVLLADPSATVTGVIIDRMTAPNLKVLAKVRFDLQRWQNIFGSGGGWFYLDDLLEIP